MAQQSESEQDQFKRLLIFFAALIAVLLLWTKLFPPPKSAAPPAPAPAVASAPAAAAASVPAVAPASSAPPAAPAIQGEKEESYILAAGLSTVTLSNRGAVATSWKLDGSVENGKTPVELVHPFSLEQKSFPLAVGGIPEADALNAALWKCAASGPRLDCEYAAGALRAKKSLVLHDDFLHELSLSVIRDDAPAGATLGWGPGFGHELTQTERRSRFSATKGNSLPAGAGMAKPLSLPGKGNATGRPGVLAADTAGVFVWYGIDDNFYGALFVPADNAPRAITIATTEHALPAPEPGAKAPDPEKLVTVAAPFSAGRLFVGPKRYDDLKRLGFSLQRAAEFDSVVPGVGPITIGLYRALLWLSARLGSWGLAIIVLTLLFRLALFPVTYKSMVNMRSMQVRMKAIQPKIDAVKQKFKKRGLDGMAEQNEELNALYKKHGINPLGGVAGCLPLLVQMPLFFGFFKLLSKVIDMKGHGFLHVHDLTAADPWLLFPILSGLFQFISSWQSSRTIADRFQRIYFTLMPLGFAFFFLFYPAGLSLYWAVSNLFTIGQQKLINAAGDRKAAEEKAKGKLKDAPAEKRAD